jgi:RHS repeat-associated protein
LHAVPARVARTDVTDVTTYTYDAQGNLRSVEDPTGLLTRYTDYSAGGLLRAMVDPAGLETRYRYDDRDRLIEVSTGAEGASQREITAYAYDEAGNLSRITLPDASYLAYRYNDEGWLEDIRDARGNRAEYGYDRLGNRDREELFDGDGQLAQTQRQVFDQLGRLRQQIGANADEITTFGYDPQGNLTSLQSPEHSRATVNRYDALNRLEHSLDALEQAVGYTYDAQDNLRTVNAPRGLVTTYTHNGFDELTQLDSPDTGRTVYSFDPAGNLLSQRDARTVSASYSYDAANRLASIDYPDERLRFGHDEATGGPGAEGRLTSARAEAVGANSLAVGNTLNYAYDLHGRITDKTQSLDGGSALRLQTDYRANGQIDRHVLPSGAVVGYTYGSDGRTLTITVNGVQIVREVEHFPMSDVQAWAYGAHGYRREHDQNGRIESHTRGSSTRSLGFDLASRIVELEDADAAQAWSFDYDDADRLTDASNAANTGATAQLTLGWTFDATGNRDQQTRQIGAASPQLTDYSTEPTSNRLSSLSVDGQARARSFDAVGNTTAWTAEAGDFAGSRMSASYGGRNRLQSVSREDAGGPVRIARYAYNAFGERIAKWTGAAATANTGAPSRQYVYDDAGRLIGEYSGSGELISEHVWLDDTPVAVLKPATSPHGGQAIAASGSAPALRAYFVHPDHLDTPRVIVNAANQTVWRWDSAPYGDTAADENPNALGEFSYSLRLPGQQYDGESGQHYNYFRDYEAATGRYVQSDPIGLDDGPNTFGYVRSGPLGSFDPDGEAIRNKVEGDRREREAFDELQQMYPCCQVLKQRRMKDSRAKTVIDRVTGQYRVLDFVVVCEGRVVEIVEVTSPTASKRDQRAKESRIRNGGGKYIKLPGRKGDCICTTGAKRRTDRRT